MESAEHMPDKPRFMRELVRVATPGGRVLIVTWCHRELAPGEQSLRRDELSLLSKINKGNDGALHVLPYIANSKGAVQRTTCLSGCLGPST
jgi:ubiquinone/menaquinone biosynthesis C-methylase UbiE